MVGSAGIANTAVVIASATVDDMTDAADHRRPTATVPCIAILITSINNIPVNALLLDHFTLFPLLLTAPASISSPLQSHRG